MDSWLLTVVVASHGRPLRLRWLLNALEEQDVDRWEVIVVHDYDRQIAARFIDDHPLCRRSIVRQLATAPGSGSPARQRNLGWRMARSPLVAFTDDDCRPEKAWLRELLEAANRNPGAIVQGRTRPDPYELEILRAPHVRTLQIDPVGSYAQTCNILYPRELLERLGGFDEHAITGEDVDLSLRARAAERTVVGAADAVVNHAVESHTLPGILRQNAKWRHLAYLVRRHPEMRTRMPLRVFWDEEHADTTLLLVGLLAGYRHRAVLALALPYAFRQVRRRGATVRQRLVAAAELPGQAVRQLAEVLGLACGSVRERTLVL